MPPVTHEPRLSVVVPVYNVEAYLDECLESLRHQQVRDMEVIFVDDGSEDGSWEIVENWKSRLPNVTALRQENKGLGAARNVGAAVATGDYLAFLDSDDTLPSGAYQRMINTLERSGSDLAVGSVLWRKGDRLEEQSWMNQIHGRRRIGVTVRGYPAVIGDPFAWNKVFRRSFYEETCLQFPTAMSYEDQPTITEAYLRARAIDVLTHPTYHYRQRCDGTSITEQRHVVDNLRDRLRSKRLASLHVNELGDQRIRRLWYRKVIAGDMLYYFQCIPGSSREYWDVLRDGVRSIWPNEYPLWRSLLLTPTRLAAWLIAQDRRDQATDLMEYLETHPWPGRVEVHRSEVLAVLPVVEESIADVPRDLFQLAPHELVWNARVLSLRLVENQIIIRGFVLVRGVPSAQVASTCTARLVGRDGDVVLDCAVESYCEPLATAWVGRSEQNFDRSGVVITIDLDRLPTRHQARWFLRLSLSLGEIQRDGAFMSSAVQPVPEMRHTRPDGSIASVTFRHGHGVVVEMED